MTDREPNPSVLPPDSGRRKQWALVGWMIAGVIVGLAGLIGSRLLLDLPRVHEPEKPLLPWLLGVPIGAGIVFVATFLLLARRHPRVVLIGIYLVYIDILVLGASALALRLTLQWFK